MPARTRSFVLSLGVLLFLAVPWMDAQIHGVPASVTSFGFGGNFSGMPGVAASVTSLGPNGFRNSPSVFGNCCFNTFRVGHQPPFFTGRHHGQGNGFFPGVVPVYTVPYTQVVVVQPEAAAYEGGENPSDDLVLVDRRALRARSGHERVMESEPATQPSAAIPAEGVVAAQPSTILVFADGHQSEVQNYAIVGDTLFDLSDGRTHKILLADLDLTATRKANEAQGVDFQVPENRAR